MNDIIRLLGIGKTNHMSGSGSRLGKINDLKVYSRLKAVDVPMAMCGYCIHLPHDRTLLLSIQKMCSYFFDFSVTFSHRLSLVLCAKQSIIHRHCVSSLQDWMWSCLFVCFTIRMDTMMRTVMIDVRKSVCLKIDCYEKCFACNRE